MKNLILMILVVCGFGLALFLEESPRGGELVASINTTLAQISKDLPAPAKKSAAGRIRRVQSNALAQDIQLDCGLPCDRSPRGEPDCGGWYD